MTAEKNSPATAPGPARWALVGARTTAERKARGQGLTLFRTVSEGRVWSLAHTLALTNPSFQVLNRAGTHAYTVHGDFSEVSVIAVSPAGGLALLQSTSTGGANPVHLCLSDDGRFLLVTNYAGGQLVCFPVLPDGLLGEPSDRLAFQGTPGPLGRHQTGPHPHQVVQWPGSAFYLVPDKGLDQLHVLRLSPQGRLEKVFTYQAPPGSGPRHLSLVPGENAFWLCLELGSAVVRLVFDPASGQVLAAGEVVSTLPVTPQAEPGDCSAAGIVLHPSRRCLYVSNRGHDSVCVMVLDPATGAATPLRWVPTQRHTPRFITLTPTADALIVANEDSDTVLRFALDGDGLPGEGQVVTHTGSPVCVSFLE